jgi:hypothetical protein
MYRDIRCSLSALDAVDESQYDDGENPECDGEGDAKVLGDDGEAERGG